MDGYPKAAMELADEPQWVIAHHNGNSAADVMHRRALAGYIHAI